MSLNKYALGEVNYLWRVVACDARAKVAREERLGERGGQCDAEDLARCAEEV
jgi:hypothetical protein